MVIVSFSYLPPRRTKEEPKRMNFYQSNKANSEGLKLVIGHKMGQTQLFPHYPPPFLVHSVNFQFLKVRHFVTGV